MWCCHGPVGKEENKPVKRQEIKRRGRLLQDHLETAPFYHIFHLFLILVASLFSSVFYSSTSACHPFVLNHISNLSSPSILNQPPLIFHVSLTSFVLLSLSARLFLIMPGNSWGGTSIIRASDSLK